MGVLEQLQQRFDASQEEELSLSQYLDLCKSDPSVYATASERLLISIGDPEFIDTSKDARLSRVFSNKIIKRYSATAARVNIGRVKRFFTFAYEEQLMAKPVFYGRSDHKPCFWRRYDGYRGRLGEKWLIRRASRKQYEQR